MMEATWISQFMDDELTLSEKIDFMMWLREDPERCTDVIALLQQETVLRTPVRMNRPVLSLSQVQAKRYWWDLLRWKMLIPIGAALMLALIIWSRPLIVPKEAPMQASVSHRFVIYAPDVRQVEIAGSFSAWRPVPMKPVGTLGYWELTLSMHPGEYRYSVLLDRNIRMPDPTVPLREADDFGTTNSILRIG